ncbi:MAG: hypothetical protein U9Q30_03085 [Campylobacterota bacterium]|nr:hypothetical protein [Campylobacterota bacterium]
MKKLLFTLFAIVPLALFASDSQVETDIVERSVNFIIFASIVYFLLADKLKDFFGNRTSSIQSELDEVQELVKDSKKKVADATLEVEKAKKIAVELIESANNDVDSIKKNVEVALEQEIAVLSRNFDDKTELEARKVKKEVVENVLNQLLVDENIKLSQSELTNIISKKVA